MKDFLAFRRMMTPVIIQAVFWIGVIGCVVSGIVTILRSGDSSIKLSSGLATLILGPIAVRIVCELLILFFRMNETLTDIRNNLAPASSPSGETHDSEIFIGSSKSEEVKQAPEVRPPVPPFNTKEEYEKWKAERMKQNEDKEKS